MLIHWAAMDQLAAFGVTPTSRRVVEQGKIITAAGVFSGIDMALHLAARIAGDDFVVVGRSFLPLRMSWHTRCSHLISRR